MLDFHTHLTSPHPYAAKAIGWLLQIRPTAFWSLNDSSRAATAAPLSSCIREVTSIGTPVLWWAATGALIWLRLALDRRAATGGPGPSSARSRPAGCRGWCSTATAPSSPSTRWRSRRSWSWGWRCCSAQILGPRDARPTRRTWGAAVVGGYVLLVIANTAWLWPLLVGQSSPYAEWLRRLWFRGWV